MSGILVLTFIGIGLFLYQQFLREDSDRLDSNGNPINRKKKRL